MSDSASQPLAKKEEFALNPHVPVARIRPVRPAPRHDSGTHGITKQDILFALFKHKGKIILGLVVGLCAAAVIYVLYPPIYQSQAKLLVRYMVERSSIDPIDGSAPSGGLSRTGQDNILGSEVEILSSWDLAVQVAEAVGPKRLIPESKTTPTKEAAAGRVSAGLELRTQPGTNIIFVGYKNSNPELATIVLNELVNRYFNKHLEVHRSAGAFDFVTQQTDQVRSRLNQTEDALRDLKDKAGIISLTESINALSSSAVRLDEQFHGAEAEVAEQEARVGHIDKSLGTTASVPPMLRKPASSSDERGASVETEPKNVDADNIRRPLAPDDVLERYQLLISRLPQLRQTRLELLAKFTGENDLVRANQTEINSAERELRGLDKKYPDLPGRVSPAPGSGTDPVSEVARLAGLRARKDSLAARLKEVQQRTQQLLQLEPQIADLQRQKELEETNYKYFEATLEKARVDEALDPSKIPNISAVQRPSPPMLVTKARDKMVMGVAVAGLAAAIAYALLKELILTETIRRPVEIEKFVGAVPLMSIPFHSKAARSAARKNGKAKALVVKGQTRENIAPWDSDHFIRRYTESIRDRLGLYFELHNLTHKPKLVGVTSFNKKAGTSTLAAGLAAALSETNDGKVLLVDVNLGPDQVHPFFKGKPAYTLTAALQSQNGINPAAENLYLAKVGSPAAGPAQLGLKKFFDLMPNIKASEFDYVIFDMPPLDQTSPTWGMSAFMDKLLVVVEAEQDSRHVVKRCYSRLMSERDNVAVVLNKTRSYAPKSFELDS